MRLLDEYLDWAYGERGSAFRWFCLVEFPIAALAALVGYLIADVQGAALAFCGWILGRLRR